MQGMSAPQFLVLTLAFVATLSPASCQQRTKSVPIVIVGAGASGLAAADRLRSLGFTNVTVLEAMARAGGRVFSAVTGTEWVELGAQWIHGSGHDVYRFASTNGLLVPKTAALYEDSATGDYFIDSARTLRATEEAIVEAVDDHFWGLDESFSCTGLPISTSMGDYFVRQFNSYLAAQTDTTNNNLRRAAFDYFLRVQIIDNAVPYLNQLSIRSSCDYEITGDENYRLNIPYSQFLDRLTNNVSRTLVRYSNAVSRISFDATRSLPVTIQTETGQILNAGHVIFTGSLGVLKASPTLFTPSLPARKQAAINAQGFFGIVKIVLYYNTPFWQNLGGQSWNSDGFQLLWPNDLLNMNKFLNDTSLNAPWTRFVASFDPSRTQRNALLMWVIGAGATMVENLSDLTVITDATALLRRFTGIPTIPAATRIVREKWNSNPRTRGTYSYFSVAAATAGYEISDLASPAWPSSFAVTGLGTRNGNALLFAGEHTHSTFFSTFHGAVLSGRREADRINRWYI